MDINKIAETIEGWAEELTKEEQHVVSEGGEDISVAFEGQNAKFQDNWPTGVWKEKMAAELVKMAKSLMAGCEKLPEGPMRDNCEKKKEEGKKKESSRRRLTARRYTDAGVEFVRQISPYEIEVKVSGPAGMGKHLQYMVESFMAINRLKESDGWVAGNSGNPARWVIYNENAPENYEYKY